MLCSFSVGLHKVYQSCLLLLLALLGLIVTLLHNASLKVPAMIVYDVATMVLDIEIFPQHAFADLISGITFIVSFSQEKLLR